MPMLTVCSNCGRLHKLDDGSCQSSRPQQSTAARDFRNQRRWKKASTEARERDKYLCQICIIEAFDTYDQYNYKSLEVNHIVPLEEDISLGLEPTNLLTMCVTHHKLADRGGIPRELMLDLAAKVLTYEDIQLRYAQGYYPPTFKT